MRAGSVGQHECSPFCGHQLLATALQGNLFGVNATFTATNPLGDPSLTSIASLTLYQLTHTVYLTGAQLPPAAHPNGSRVRHVCAPF